MIQLRINWGICCIKIFFKILKIENDTEDSLNLDNTNFFLKFSKKSIYLYRSKNIEFLAKGHSVNYLKNYVFNFGYSILDTFLK